MPRGFLTAVFIFCALIALAWVSLQAVQQDRTLHTEITIAAPPETVWRALTNFEEYPLWNPFIVSFSGSLVEDSRVSITLSRADGSTSTFTPRITRVDRPRELAWHGSLAVPGFFEGTHRFQLTATPDGGTRFEQSEEFTGLLIGPLMQGVLTETEASFRRMNQALKDRAEKAHAAGRDAH